MNCKRCRKRIHEYLDDALPPRVRSSVEQHLGDCDHCRAALAQERQFSGSTADLLRERVHSLRLDPNVSPKIVTALKSGVSAPRIRGYRRNVVLRPALALGIVAALVIAAFAILTDHQPPPSRRAQPIPEHPKSFVMCMGTTYADETKTDWIERRLIVEMKNGIEGYLEVVAKKPAKPTEREEEEVS